jgi:ADP-ribosylglycohydrolase
MAAIPLGLWFHDDESRLHAAIRTSVGLGVDAPIVGYAIAKILQEKLEPATFFWQLKQWLSTWEPEKPLPASLEIVEQGLQNQEPLAKVAQTLGKSNHPQGEVAVLRALFCFLSTPDFPDISINRAIRNSQQAALVGSITGAFSGAYNGIAKLPVKWEIVLQETPIVQRWGVDSMEQLRSWSVRLLAAWCGTFTDRNAIACTTTEWTFPTVAAAGQLRT